MCLLEFGCEIVGEIEGMLGAHHMMHTDERFVQGRGQCLGCARTDAETSCHTYSNWIGTHTFLQKFNSYLAHA